MDRWFDLFSVWGYRNSRVTGIDLDVCFLGIGSRALFSFTIEMNTLEEVNVCFFRFQTQHSY